MLVAEGPQLQFDAVWDPGICNLADHFTKHHPGSHHQRVRPIYLHENNSPTDLQGCIRILDQGRTDRTARTARAAESSPTSALYPKPVTKYAKTVATSRPRVGEYAYATNLRIGQNMLGSYFNQLSKVIQ